MARDWQTSPEQTAQDMGNLYGTEWTKDSIINILSDWIQYYCPVTARDFERYVEARAKEESGDT